MAFAFRMCQPCVCDPESPLARADLLSHPYDSAARIRLHRRRGQERGSSFYALNNFIRSFHSVLAPIKCEALHLQIWSELGAAIR